MRAHARTHALLVFALFVVYPSCRYCLLVRLHKYLTLLIRHWKCQTRMVNLWYIILSCMKQLQWNICNLKLIEKRKLSKDVEKETVLLLHKSMSDYRCILKYRGVRLCRKIPPYQFEFSWRLVYLRENHSRNHGINKEDCLLYLCQLDYLSWV